MANQAGKRGGLDIRELERRQTVANNAMPVLVHRLGGEVTITQADFDEMAAAYGSYENIAVAAEMRDGALRLKLTRNPRGFGSGENSPT